MAATGVLERRAQGVYRPRRAGGELYEIHHVLVEAADRDEVHGVTVVSPALAIRQAIDWGVASDMIEQAVRRAQSPRTHRNANGSTTPRSPVRPSVARQQLRRRRWPLTDWKAYFDSWMFVPDDINGMAPLIAKHVVELDAKSKQVSCSAWGTAELREEFACVHDADREAILGPLLTSQHFMSVDASTLRPLIDAA